MGGSQLSARQGRQRGSKQERGHGDNRPAPGRGRTWAAKPDRYPLSTNVGNWIKKEFLEPMAHAAFGEMGVSFPRPPISTLLSGLVDGLPEVRERLSGHFL